jgi:5-methylcytosine-specific restriction endonuclease McrA
VGRVSLTKTPPEVRRQVLDRYLIESSVGPGKVARYKCAACGKGKDGRGFVAPALQIDHVIPEIDSTPEMRDDPANMQPLCAPKGSTRLNSCHKAKTAREAAARALLNKPPTDWWPTARYFGAAWLAGGATYATATGSVHFTPAQWMQYNVIGGGVLFLTKLVHNGLRFSAPREVIRPEPIPEPSPGAPQLDPDRINQAMREVVGQKGTVDIRVDGLNRFEVRYPGTGFEDHKDDRRYELLAKMTSKLGDRWVPNWETSEDRVQFTRRPAMPKMVYHPGLSPDRPWHVLPIADGVAFDVLVTPHVLIAGETLGGKTAIQRAMLIAALDTAKRDPKKVEVDIADPKQVEFMGFSTWPGVHSIVTDPVDLWEFAYEIMNEMNRRYRERKVNGVPFGEHKRRFVFWDEQEEFRNAVQDVWTSGGKDSNDLPYKKSGEREPGALRAVARTLAMSRRCGIYNIIATQSPDASVFGKSGVRQNLPGRASVGAIDDIRARWLFGDSSVGRDIPSNAKGRATVQIGDGTPVECQTYWVPDPADSDLEYRNTREDWDTLLRLGMPKELVKL